MINEEIKVFSPATVANVSSGFDVLGMAIDQVGDTLVMRKTQTLGATINLVEGAELPMEPEKNIASYVAMLMLKKSNADFGIEIDIYKGAMGGSGLGSSASSCAAAAVGTNHFLGNKYSNKELISFAAEGERIACGAPITDNVAPAILGGIVFIQNPKDRKFIALPIPEDLYVVVIHPQVEVTTEESRAVMKKTIDLGIVTRQMASFGGLLIAFFTQNYSLMKESMVDYLAEPYRHNLIPGYKTIREAAMKAGAIGGGISGSGPSVFHFCHGKETAQQVYNAIDQAYPKEKTPYKMYLSSIESKGTHLVK